MYFVPNDISKPPMPVAPEGWDPIVFGRISLSFEANPKLRQNL